MLRTAREAPAAPKVGIVSLRCPKALVEDADEYDLRARPLPVA